MNIEITPSQLMKIVAALQLLSTECQMTAVELQAQARGMTDQHDTKDEKHKGGDHESKKSE